MKCLMSTRAACTIALLAACLMTTTTFAQGAHTTDQFHGVYTRTEWSQHLDAFRRF
jgi:hypothetical protein